MKTGPYKRLSKRFRAGEQLTPVELNLLLAFANINENYKLKHDVEAEMSSNRREPLLDDDKRD